MGLVWFFVVGNHTGVLIGLSGAGAECLLLGTPCWCWLRCLCCCCTGLKFERLLHEGLKRLLHEGLERLLLEW